MVSEHELAVYTRLINLLFPKWFLIGASFMHKTTVLFFNLSFLNGFSLVQAIYTRLLYYFLIFLSEHDASCIHKTALLFELIVS